MNEKKVLPFSTLIIGEDIYKVQFSMYSLLKYQELTGKNLLKGQLDINEPNEMVHFLWAGCIQNHPELDGDIIDGKPSDDLRQKLAKLAKLMTFDRFVEIGAALKESFFNAMPNQGEAEDSEKK